MSFKPVLGSSRGPRRKESSRFERITNTGAAGGLRRGPVGTALVFGAAWGLAEATLGHLLHLLRVPGLPGLVMVPLAVWIMGRVATRSSSAAAVILTGTVAASFKLLDLLVPGTDLLALIHPIQAILLEALAGGVWVQLAALGPLRAAPPVTTGGKSRFGNGSRGRGDHCLWPPHER